MAFQNCNDIAFKAAKEKGTEVVVETTSCETRNINIVSSVGIDNIRVGIPVNFSVPDYGQAHSVNWSINNIPQYSGEVFSQQFNNYGEQKLLVVVKESSTSRDICRQLVFNVGCPTGQDFVNGSCNTVCPSGQSLQNGSCVTACIPPRITINGSCQLPPTVTCQLPVSLGGNTISEGQSVTAYGAASVACGQTCTPQTRVCNNINGVGVLSGSNQVLKCQAISCSCTEIGALQFAPGCGPGGFSPPCYDRICVGATGDSLELKCCPAPQD